MLGAGNGWPGEQWLDIRQLSVLEPIMTARLQMCQQKGFDAVEPDNMDGSENSTGFPLQASDQLAYDEWIAGEAHSLGMAVLQFLSDVTPPCAWRLVLGPSGLPGGSAGR